MLVVETIAKIRRAYFQDGKSIKQICRDLRVSRNTVRKVVRSGVTELTYERSVQPQPKIGLWKAELDRMLEENARKPKRDRLTRIRLFEELQVLGYAGGYDAVRRYAAAWAKSEREATASAYVPLTFAPGEAYQFDWSHEIVLIDGVTMTLMSGCAIVECSPSGPIHARHKRWSSTHTTGHLRSSVAPVRGASTTAGIVRHWSEDNGRGDSGGDDLRGPRAGLQSPLPTDVRALSCRSAFHRA